MTLARLALHNSKAILARIIVRQLNAITDDNAGQPYLIKILKYELANATTKVNRRVMRHFY
jgi:hypothetical protein